MKPPTISNRMLCFKNCAGVAIDGGNGVIEAKPVVWRNCTREFQENSTQRQVHISYNSNTGAAINILFTGRWYVLIYVACCGWSLNNAANKAQVSTTTPMPNISLNSFSRRLDFELDLAFFFVRFLFGAALLSKSLRRPEFHKSNAYAWHDWKTIG